MIYSSIWQEKICRSILSKLVTSTFLIETIENNSKKLELFSIVHLLYSLDVNQLKYLTYVRI